MLTTLISDEGRMVQHIENQPDGQKPVFLAIWNLFPNDVVPV